MKSGMPGGAASAEAHLAAIVNSSDDAILLKDPEGIIQWCNPAAERLFGYTTQELVGRSVRILIPPERQPEEDEILERIRRGERISHYETVRIARDGRRIDVSLTVSPVLDEAGNLIGISKTARDITERRRAAAELAAQQEWFRVTLASIGDAVIASTPDGCVTYLNRCAELLTGWKLEEAQGRLLTEVFQILNEDTGKPVDNPAVLVMRHGHVVGLGNHTVLISRDGTHRPIADSAAPIRDAEGRIIGVVLVFRDVTEERRAEMELAEQREWLETTLEGIGDGVIAADVCGRITFINPVAENLTGWRSEDAYGRPSMEVFRIVNEKTRQPAPNPVTRVLAEGTVVGLANHTVLIAADGTERPIEDSAAPIRSRDGRMLGVVLVFRDATERRRVEQERSTAAAERERLLETERMARAEAERANRAKDEFIAIVSHELRTPLNAILGWTHLMMRNRSDTTLLETGLDVVARNTRVQAQLISDLLDLSRIDSGKLLLEIQSVDLSSVVRDAIQAVEHDAAAAGIEIEQHVDPGLGVIAGDPARLQQVIWNLLSNALKFTPGGGRVTLAVNGIRGGVEIRVSDTGVGIPPHVLPRIFERFQQADRSSARRFGGLGLGLSIVKHLVELHGGSVHADSAGEGKGATFVVRLPSGAPPQVMPEAARAANMPDEHLSLRGLRVLVVEDEIDTRDFLARLLAAHDARVEAVASAREGLASFKARRPDVIVSDIGLPDMDGYDFMEAIRRKPTNEGGSVPAIALTAYGRQEDRTRALRAGYQAHVAKPVEPGEIIAIIHSLGGLIRRHQRN